MNPQIAGGVEVQCKSTLSLCVPSRWSICWGDWCMWQPACHTHLVFLIVLSSLFCLEKKWSCPWGSETDDCCVGLSATHLFAPAFAKSDSIHLIFMSRSRLFWQSPIQKELVAESWLCCAFARTLNPVKMHPNHLLNVSPWARPESVFQIQFWPNAQYSQEKEEFPQNNRERDLFIYNKLEYFKIMFCDEVEM